MSEHHNHQPLVNEVSQATKASLKSRVIVAIVLILLLAPAFIFGNWVFFALVIPFLLLAGYEFIKAPGKKYHWWVWVLTFGIILAYVYWFVIKANLRVYQISKHDGVSFVFSLENYYSGLDISVIGIATALGIYFLIALLDKDFTFSDLAYFMTFTLLLGLAFQSFFFLRYYPYFLFGYSPAFKDMVIFGNWVGTDLISQYPFMWAGSAALILFVIVGSTANDTAAYFGGMLFGKHHMNERVSPHKTWEGFFFGILGGTVSSLAIGLTMAACGFPILPTLDLNHWYYIALLGILIPLFGDLGDLSLSLIKRHFGIKDFGSILPGHGGILDRIDSHMFAAIGTTAILILITNQWNFTL